MSQRYLLELDHDELAVLQTGFLSAIAPHGGELSQMVISEVLFLKTLARNKECALTVMKKMQAIHKQMFDDGLCSKEHEGAPSHA